MWYFSKCRYIASKWGPVMYHLPSPSRMETLHQAPHQPRRRLSLHSSPAVPPLPLALKTGWDPPPDPLCRTCSFYFLANRKQSSSYAAPDSCEKCSLDTAQSRNIQPVLFCSCYRRQICTLVSEFPGSPSRSQG